MKKASMIKARSLFAVLSVALLLAASDARAAFTYFVSATPTVFTSPSALSTFTVSPSSSATGSNPLTGTTDINLFQGTLLTTRTTTGTDSGGGPLALTLTINRVGDGSMAINLAGTLSFTTSVDTSTNPPGTSGTSDFVLTTPLPASLTVGGVTYTLSQPANYSGPTVNNPIANGGFTIRITEGAVPEPASLVMMGTSVLALGGLTVLRRRRQG